jgi:hypothetical protein
MGYPDNSSRPGDPALIDVLTMCDNLQTLGHDPVVAPAKALGEIVRNRLVRWHHSQQGRYQGTSLYYKPVTEHDLEGSYIQPADEDEAATDAKHYRTLALCHATHWDRIALHPLAI